MFDINSPEPLYVQLKEKLRQDINKEIIKPHQRIPSERELCQKYNLSRTTVRQAISEAENEGLLYRIHGKGTFVAGNKIHQGLAKITGFDQTLIRRGMTPSMRLVEKEVLSADVQVANLLHLEMADGVLRFTILGLGDDEPMHLSTIYVSLHLGKELLPLLEEADRERRWLVLPDVYRKQGYNLWKAHQTFEAITADEKISSALKIAIGAPIFKVTSIYYTKEEEPVELKYSYYRGDRYQFHFSREIG